MKLSIVVIGAITGIVGLLSRWSEWKLLGFFSLPTPLSFLRPLYPYANYIMLLGAIVFLVGLFLKRGD